MCSLATRVLRVLPYAPQLAMRYQKVFFYCCRRGFLYLSEINRRRFHPHARVNRSNR